MTGSPPITAGAPVRVHRITLWKMTEAVRLYLWPVAVLLVVTAAVAGFRDGYWWAAGSVLALAVLVLMAGEAARASVCSQRFVVQAAMRARSQ